MKKLYTRKSGWLVEHPRFNSDFIKYLFIRSISFVIDFFLFLTLQWILQKTVGFTWIVAASVSYVLFLVYNSLMLISFNCATLGLKAGKLEVINKYHTERSVGRLLVRSSITAFFAMSYIGYGFMVVNVIAILLTRGLGLSDVISGTQVVSVKYADYLREIESKYDEEITW